ncbi:MAG: U32 family peptidase, partial [Duncaniella sp.]|nr:U32 family peptidase [Duncaniella sp.]
QDNVPNRISSEIYTSHVAVDVADAVETARPADYPAEVPVMTTRYCLRRELGKCLKDPSGKDWRGPLTLVSGTTRMRVDFDCRNCRMNLYKA